MVSQSPSKRKAHKKSDIKGLKKERKKKLSTWFELLCKTKRSPYLTFWSDDDHVVLNESNAINIYKFQNLFHVMIK